MHNEVSTQSVDRWNESERSDTEEVIRIVARATDEDALIALPWIGWQYRNKSNGR